MTWICLNSLINRMFSYLFAQFMINCHGVKMCRYLLKIILSYFGLKWLCINALFLSLFSQLMCNSSGVKMSRYLCKHNLNKLRVLKYSGLNSLYIKRIFQLTSQSLFICHSVKINSNIVTYFLSYFLLILWLVFVLFLG